MLAIAKQVDTSSESGVLTRELDTMLQEFRHEQKGAMSKEISGSEVDDASDFDTTDTELSEFKDGKDAKKLEEDPLCSERNRLLLLPIQSKKHKILLRMSTIIKKKSIQF